MTARIRDLLVQRGLLSPEQSERALRNPAGQWPVEYAVRQGWCDDEAVGRLIAETCAVPYVDITVFDADPDVLSLVPPELLLKHRLLPFALHGDVLVVVMADPTNIYAQDDVKFLTGRELEVCTSGPVAIIDAIHREEDLGWPDTSSFALGYMLQRKGVAAGMREWVMGRAFAFHPGSETVLFLRDDREHALGDVATASALGLGPSAPRILFTDRELYGPRDIIRVGVFCAAKAGKRARVMLRTGTSMLPPLDLELDGNGLGWTSLPAPPPGSYTLMTEWGGSASFSVATYLLSPLQVRWCGERADGEALEGELEASVLGEPLEGTLVLGLMDESGIPARRVHTARVTTDGSGRARVRLPRVTRGPASLEVRVEGRAGLTATVRLAGTEQESREPVVLSRWQEERLASSLPFAGSQPFRGLHVGPGAGGVSAPLRIVEVTRERVLLELTRPVHRGQVVAVVPGLERFEVPITGGVPGLRLELPARGPWTLLMVGVLERSEAGLRCWEGRAAVLPPSLPLELDVPPTARPGDAVALALRGSPGASVWVSVRDARLTARAPGEVAAAALRKDLDDTLAGLRDGEPDAILGDLFPRRRRSRVLMDEIIVGAVLDTAAGDRSEAAAPPALAEEPPAVVLCQVVTLDAEGLARLDFRAPRLRGRLEVDVLAALGLDWVDTRASLTVHQPVHGELLLPRYVSAGERAAGTLHVALDSGSAEVEVRYEGTPLLLHAQGRSAHRLRLSAPGAEVLFDAMAGRFEAEVRADSGEVQRVGGQVDHPGRAQWLERTVVALAPGGRLEVEG
ncbi:hypothetical protein HPC49_24300, partial [Pyxidicoccus fallax]